MDQNEHSRFAWFWGFCIELCDPQAKLTVKPVLPLPSFFNNNHRFFLHATLVLLLSCFSLQFSFCCCSTGDEENPFEYISVGRLSHRGLKCSCSLFLWTHWTLGSKEEEWAHTGTEGSVQLRSVFFFVCVCECVFWSNTTTLMAWQIWVRMQTLFWILLFLPWRMGHKCYSSSGNPCLVKAPSVHMSSRTCARQ